MGFTVRLTICPEIQNSGSENGELADSGSNCYRQLADLQTISQCSALHPDYFPNIPYRRGTDRGAGGWGGRWGGQVGRGGEGQGGQAPPPPSAPLSANSDFSDPKFRISGGMVGQRVKPIYRHKFHTWFQAFWATKKFLLGETYFLPNGAPLVQPRGRTGGILA